MIPPVIEQLNEELAATAARNADEGRLLAFGRRYDELLRKVTDGTATDLERHEFNQLSRGVAA